MKANVRLASVVFVLIFPVIAIGQTTLNFPLPVDAASGSQVGYALVNPNRASATVSFKSYDEVGAETGSTSVSIPAGGQVSRLFSELFTNTTANGWVQATSSASGVQGFTLGGDFVNNVDGVASASAAVDQVFPLMGNTTAIVVTNPTSYQISLTMKLLTSGGGEVAAFDFILPGRGMAIRPLLDLPYIGTEYAAARYVRITGSDAFAATALVAQYLIAKPEFALYNGIDVSKAGGVLNFPHVVSGDLGGIVYETAVALTNLSNADQSVTITFTPDSGFGAKSIQVFLTAGATIRESVSFPGSGFQNGWLQVRSGGPIAGVMVVTNAGARGAGIAVVQPQTTSSTEMVFSHIANVAPWSTGLAFVNTTQVPATIDLVAVNPNGTEIGRASLTLNPGAKVARLLTELVPQSQASNGGFVSVRTTGTPVFGLELFSLRSGGPVANVPAQ